HAMAYDVSRARVVLFGGQGDGGRLDDTWEWDGASWTQLNPLTSPPPSAGHGMAWDPAGERVLVYADGVTWLFLP
ncbi:MAG TPA: kelch repeat-containing protein, partial [Archangium sp.]